MNLSISSFDSWSGCFWNIVSHAFMIVRWYIFFGLIFIASSFTGESFGFLELAGGMATVFWEQNESLFCGDGEISRWGKCTMDKEGAGLILEEAGFGLEDLLLIQLVILLTFLRILAGLWWHILMQAGDPHFAMMEIIYLRKDVLGWLDGERVFNKLGLSCAKLRLKLTFLLRLS